MSRMLEALRQIQARGGKGGPVAQDPPVSLPEDTSPKQPRVSTSPQSVEGEKGAYDLAKPPAAADSPVSGATTFPDVDAPARLADGNLPPSSPPKEILPKKKPPVDVAPMTAPLPSSPASDAGENLSLDARTNLKPPSSSDRNATAPLRSVPASAPRASHGPSLDLPKTVALKAAPPKATGPTPIAIATAPPRIELPPEVTARPETPAVQDLPGGRCDLGSLLARSPDGRHEEFERTAENILAQLAARRSSMLLFLGTSRAEADCAVLVRLGAALARHAATDVLLVDCTFQNSPLPEPSGRHSRHNLVDVLRGAADWRNVIATTNVPGLHVLRGSRFPGSGVPPEGLKFGPLLDPLRRQYRLVLLLTATSAHSDVARLVRHCDGTYLLMSLHHTAPNEAKEVIRRVVRCGGHVLGCVVTGA